LLQLHSCEFYIYMTVFQPFADAGSSSHRSAHLIDERFCSPPMPKFRFTPICLLAVACCVSAQGQSTATPQQFAATGSSPVAPVKNTSTAVPATPKPPAQRTLRQVGMVDIPGSPGFDQIAIASGKVLLTHTSDSSLDVVDPVKRRVVAQIINLKSPRGIAVDTTNHKIYVAQAGNNSIAVINFEGWQYAGSIPVTLAPSAVALDDSGQRLYWAGAQSNSLSILDLTTRQNLGTIDLGGRPRGIVWDQERGVAFVVLQDTAEVVAVDPKLQVVSRFKLNASQPTELVYDAHTRRLYVAARNAVLAINDQDGTETNRVTAPMGVDGLWLNPESRTLYAASPTELTVITADNGHFAVVDNIASNFKGHNVAFDSESNMVFLPGGREGKSAMLLLRPMSSEQSGSEPAIAAKVK
jgi:YVTN family beta-propeller protein